MLSLHLCPLRPAGMTDEVSGEELQEEDFDIDSKCSTVQFLSLIV